MFWRANECSSMTMSRVGWALKKNAVAGRCGGVNGGFVGGHVEGVGDGGTGVRWDTTRRDRLVRRRSACLSVGGMGWDRLGWVRVG